MPERDTTAPPSLTLADILPADRNSFSAVRLGMAMAVLVLHAFYLAAGTSDAEPLQGWTGYTLGQHGVQVFFILSGILVAQSLHCSGSVLDFAVARALRILPGLIVCVLATALVVGPAVSTMSASSYLIDIGVYSYMIKTISLATGMAPLPGVFEHLPATGVVNSSLWTLKYEVICYTILALAGSLIMRFKRPEVAFAGVLTVWFATVVMEQPALLKTNGLVQNIRYFALFFGFGVIAYAMRRHLVLHWGPTVALFGLAVAVRGTYFTEMGYALCLTYGMLYAASFSLGRLGAHMARNDYSYGVYIYSVPATQLILLVSPGQGLPALILGTIALSLLCARLSWMLIEQPALAMRPAITARLRCTSLPTRLSFASAQN